MARFRSSFMPKRWHTAIALSFGATALGVLVSGDAAAQSVDENLVTPNLPLVYDRGRNVSVLQRERPDYQALGISAGSFILYPKLETGIGATSNAYQAEPAEGDFYASIAPSILAASNWSNHELVFNGGARIKRFFDETPRNETNYTLDLSGRLDASRIASISTNIRTARATEPRASAVSPQDAIDAVQYQQTGTGIAAKLTGTKLRGQLAVNADTLTFFDVRTFGGTIRDQRSRNQTLLRVTGRGEYAASPDTAVFVQGGYIRTRYDIALAPGIANRDSNEVSVLGGATFDLAALVRGAVGIGYVRRSYESPRYRDIGGVAAEAQVEYFFSQLTTFSLNLRRTVQDSAFNNSSGYFATAGALRVDHELLRNLLLNAQAAYEVDKFPLDTGTIHITRFSGGARYLANRSLGFGFLLGHDKRSSSGAVGLGAFNETRGLLSVVVQR